MQQYLPAKPGPIESVEGEALGEHEGLMYHTLGQRKGLHIGGMADNSGEPRYVVDKDVRRNVLIVAQERNIRVYTLKALLQDNCTGLVEAPHRRPSIAQ